ncbi:unnamed protein product [Rotaria socialis]
MYVQHNGVAMGAPLAPVIADIFLSHLEETLMDRLVKSGVCEWFRYVDDTFILIEPNTNINDLLNILNTFHPSISFTHEVERDGSLSFLDVCVTRSLTSQKLDTTIYRKPTYTGLLIKWDSFVPLSYKKACIVSMVQRALAVCSTYALLSQEFQTIREIGQKNDYPSSFIDTRIGIGLGNYLKKLTTSNEAVAGCAKQRMYVEIPYTGTSSKMLKNKLSRISIKHRPDLEVCFFERPSPPVQIIFNVKDPIPKHLQANIIYSIQCSNCGDAYVGKTERQGIRRPSYIRLNQSAIRPKHQQETEIKKQHQDIYSKVEKHLTGSSYRIPRNNVIFKQYSDHLVDYLNDSYFTPLVYKDQLISREQAEIVGAIRRIIENMNLIIRATDKGNNFYIGLANTFEQKAENFFSDTNAFTELSSNPFNEILDKVIQLLNTLRGKDLIRKWQYEQMMPDRTNCELAHLYFNPKTHKDGIPVRPIENTIHASTKKVSKFLDKILRPIFDDKCKDTTIIDGASLITDLSKYNKKGLLKSTTLFCTFDIRNLYTMLPQEEALNTLMKFLATNGYRKVKGISIDTIKKLSSIVIKDNAFAYGEKIYKQTTGGAMGSSFTLTLANIFMSEWQTKLAEEQTKTGELYGRYIDDVFMTWNRSEEELRKLLDDVNTWHPNIKLDYKIGNSLPFLDVQLTNNNGTLATSVYHKPAAEPYVTPFTSDHPRHVFANILKTSVERATRYSSTFEELNNERRKIKLMLLYNGYPSTFIENEFKKYFSEYISNSPFLNFIDNENKYNHTRQKLLGLPTLRQSQVAMSAAQANIDNDEADDRLNQPDESTKQPEKKTFNFDEKLFIHFTHENRFHTYRKDLHQIYNDVFQQTPAMDTRLIVRNRNRRETQNELIRKRPTKAILQNKQPRISFQQTSTKLFMKTLIIRPFFST